MSPDKKTILEALEPIIDPDFDKSIVELGFIRDLSVEGAKVSFAINLTTPACPVKGFFREEAEKRVLALEGVEEVEVAFTASNPNAKQEELLKKSGLKLVKTIVAVSSCKGGVGKSTVAAALAKQLAGRGYKVGLLDADVYGPSMPTLFGLVDVSLEFDKERRIVPVLYEGMKVLSFGFVAGDSPSVMRGPMVSNYTKQLLHGVSWGELDYLLLDMPPGTGDIPLTLAQSVNVQGALIITTPHELSLTDVGKGIVMFEKLNIPVLGVVENMAYFYCEDNGKSYSIFGEGAAKKLQKRFGLELLGRLPIEQSFQENLVLGSKKDLDLVVDNIIRAIGKSVLRMDKTPDFGFDSSNVRVSWSKGKSWSFANAFLRYHCNSAKNVDERTGLRLVKWEDIPKDICAVQVYALGNYAMAVSWNDGHRSIFPYVYLEELSKNLRIGR